ncbi:transposase [Anopheles sinensis]|uniref:Transposase n=1 Tax=Anopheles sinensis TaxID=74873 RepID=A0A084WFT8_ANOSI|nr:transposase [Anopheles sinensis]
MLRSLLPSVRRATGGGAARFAWHKQFSRDDRHAHWNVGFTFGRDCTEVEKSEFRQGGSRGKNWNERTRSRDCSSSLPCSKIPCATGKVGKRAGKSIDTVIVIASAHERTSLSTK